MPVSGHSQAIGSSTYSSFQSSSRRISGTAQTIGATTYSSWSNGYSSVSQRVGGVEYTTTNTGTSYTLDGVCRRLLAAVEASFPGVVADWIDSRQARLEAEISQLLRDQHRSDDTPF